MPPVTTPPPESGASETGPGEGKSDARGAQAGRASLTRLDRVGAACSTVCAVHCASTAVLPGALAFLGLGVLLDPAFEWAFTAFAILFALAAVALTWRKHRIPWIGAMYVLGIVGLASARLLESSGVYGVGPVLGVLSGLLLAAGHLAGLRTIRALRQAA